MYAIQILLLVVIGGITASLLKLLYNPTKHFTRDLSKRRFVGHSLPSEQLQLLICAHDEHNASPLLSLLSTSLPSPTSLFLLHLSPLVGHTTPVLAPYKLKRHQRLGVRLSVTDHIVNAFRYLEQSYPDALSVHPFVNVSPYATMHNDICQLAFDNRIAMIILPFHRYANIQSGVICVNPAIRTVNTNVLRYAPCTVAIHLHYGISSDTGPRFLRSVVVYFLGGEDDREALAYAARIADNVSIGLTVIRLILTSELREGDEEVTADDDVIGGFNAMYSGNKRVVYKQVEVKDGVEMIELVKETSGEYSLAVVGRRERERSRLTDGLEMWSEYPELGVVGDVLASEDLGQKVSTLVVQKRHVLPSNEEGKL